MTDRKWNFNCRLYFQFIYNITAISHKHQLIK